jgi:hypothetical protein
MRRRSKGYRTKKSLAKVLGIRLRIVTYVGRSVELEVLVQLRDLLDLIVLQVEASDIQVLRQAVRRVRLRNDGDTTLCAPPEQNLCGSLAVCLGDLLDDRVVEEQRGVSGDLHVALDEGLRTEG